MVQSQYDQSEILTYDLEEGTFTVAYTLLVPNGVKALTGTFAKQVNENNFLKQGDGDNTLALADTAADVATHFNPLEPEPSTALPTATTTQANLNDLRIVGAVALKPGEFFLPVKATNVKIAPKDKLVVAAGGQGVDKAVSATTNVAIAQENVAANTGGFIRARVSGPIVVE